MKEYIFHGVIEKEGDVYCALCLELDIATEADTLESAKKNLKEAVEGYVESVVREGEEEEFIPRPAPEEVLKEYEHRFKVTTHPCVNPIEQTEGINGDPLSAS